MIPLSRTFPFFPSFTVPALLNVQRHLTHKWIFWPECSHLVTGTRLLRKVAVTVTSDHYLNLSPSRTWAEISILLTWAAMTVKAVFAFEFCCGVFLAVSSVLKLCFQSLPLAILISATFFLRCLASRFGLDSHVLSHCACTDTCLVLLLSIRNMEFALLESRRLIYENVPIWLADCDSFHLFRHFDHDNIMEALPVEILLLVLLRSSLWNISLPGLCNCAWFPYRQRSPWKTHPELMCHFSCRVFTKMSQVFMGLLDFDLENLLCLFFRAFKMGAVRYNRCHVEALCEFCFLPLGDWHTHSAPPLVLITLSNVNTCAPFFSFMHFLFPLNRYHFFSILVTLNRLKLKFLLTCTSLSSALISKP